MASASGGLIRIKRVTAELVYRLHVAHVLEIRVIPDGNLLYLVRGAEAVEEVYKRDSALYGGKMGDRSEIHDLLHVALREHGKACLTARHDVAVVAEDAQCLRGDSSRRDMEHGRQLLRRDLIHIRDHKKETLRSGIGRGERARAERAVYRAGGARLGLHFDDLYPCAENVLLTCRRPLVDEVRHWAGRRYRVNARHFGVRIGH